jgi:hypothetical protein
MHPFLRCMRMWASIFLCLPWIISFNGQKDLHAPLVVQRGHTTTCLPHTCSTFSSTAQLQLHRGLQHDGDSGGEGGAGDAGTLETSELVQLCGGLGDELGDELGDGLGDGLPRQPDDQDSSSGAPFGSDPSEPGESC